MLRAIMTKLKKVNRSRESSMIPIPALAGVYTFGLMVYSLNVQVLRLVSTITVDNEMINKLRASHVHL